MATFTFDGTSSITATKDDTVFITANPQSFTQATDNGANVSLAFGGSTLTITGTTLSADGLPNVFVSGGQFAFAGDTNNNMPASTGNVLSFLVDGTYAAPTDGTANSKIAIFGGLGRVDSIDGADSITIGGKGSILVYGNAGADSIGQTVAFDSASIVNVNGDAGADSIFLNQANLKASIFAGGGAGADVISVVNSGSTTIFGGLDSTDAGDRITFSGVNGAAGTSQIFGNGGNDSIGVGFDSGNGIDSTSTTTVYGGVGNDLIQALGRKAAISVLGNEGSDNIFVSNSGNTYIAGGNQSGDQSLDGADSIYFQGTGNALIYGNAGADSINAFVYGNDSTDVSDISNVSIYGGKDGDLINVSAFNSNASVFVVGGEGGDSIDVSNFTQGGATTIYGGVGASDSADGADTISYSGSGVANIFGNGGADSISIGGVGSADSTNATVTVSGGAGADSITIFAQRDGAQSIVVSGNEGADTFTVDHGAGLFFQDVATGRNITIADFNTSSDKLALTNLFGTSPGQLQVTTGSFQTLQQALDAASKASGATDGSNDTAVQNKAAAVVFGGSTYVVIENGAASSGFSASSDQAIKLTGVTDLVGLVGNTTITGTTMSKFPNGWEL